MILRIPTGDAKAFTARALGAPLNAETAVQLALLNNPDLRSHAARLGFAASELYEATRLSNPTFSVTRLTGDSSEGANVPQLTLGIALDFVNLLFLPANTRFAEAQFGAAKLEMGNAALGLAAEVESAWYQAVGAQQLELMRQTAAKAQRASADLAQRYFEAGNLNARELAMERSSASQATLAAISARAEAVESRSTLNRLMGLSASQAGWALEARLAEPVPTEDDVAQLQRAAFDRRLDLLALRQRSKAIADRFGIVRATRLVEGVEIGVECERDFDGALDVGPTLSIPPPLFNWGGGRTAAIGATFHQAEAELDGRVLDVSNGISLAAAKVQAQRELAREYRDALVPQRETVVARFQEEQNYMLVGVFEVLAAKQQSYEAYAGYIEAVRDYWTARSELARQVGARLPSSDQESGPTVDADAFVRPQSEGDHGAHEHHSTHGHHDAASEAELDSSAPPQKPSTSPQSDAHRRVFTSLFGDSHGFQFPIHLPRSITMTSRRELLQALAAGGAGLLASRPTWAQHEGHDMHGMDTAAPTDKRHLGEPVPPASEVAPPRTLHRHPQGYVPVRALNGWTLPYRLKGGVKEFHLVAEEIEHEFAPGCRAKCWGYNGTTPGPTIEVVEGDRVRIFVTNRLREPTTMHWHGIDVPNGQDGVGGLNQPHIQPSETFVYEYTLRQNGTHMYHPHADEMTQMAFGMMGLFIIHPKKSEEVPVDREYAFLLHNWALHPGTYRPDPSVMQDFDLWTFNSKVFPAIEHPVARTGERIRFRIGNLSMWNHPIHLHSNPFWVTGSDGGRWPRAQWRREVTEIIGVGQMRDYEFLATEPGDWALHCHMAHHTMNAMGHGVPNPTGVDQRGVAEDIRQHLPGYVAMGKDGMSEHAEHLKMGMPGPHNTLPMMSGDGQFGSIEMGGMFTVVKVRDDLLPGDYTDPGWYRFPTGTVAHRVSTDPSFGNPPRRDPYSKPPVAPFGGVAQPPTEPP